MDEDPRVPDRLASALRSAYLEQPSVPEDGAASVLAASRAGRRAAGFRRGPWRSAGGLAAAAMVAVVGGVVWLARPSSPAASVAAVERSPFDANGDGAVDILDALASHRAALGGGEVLVDADEIASRVVDLDRNSG